MPPTKKEVTKIKELCYFLCKLWTLFNEKKTCRKLLCRTWTFETLQMNVKIYFMVKPSINSNQTH